MSKNLSAKLKKIEESVMDLDEDELDRLHLITINEKIVLDSSDIKILFNISDKTLYRWRKLGKIKFTRVAGKCFYVWHNILSLLETRLLDI